MADDIAKKRAALNVGNLIKDTGFVQGPSLSSIFAEYAASLPETTAKNAIAMNNMVQNSMPYNFDPRSNGVNPNYDPQAAKEFANYIPNLMGATAYHGTPHNIRGDFDLAKVGTGEGAQSYGHGMYFAENPKVAGEYQRKLSGWDTGTKLALGHHGGLDNAIAETEKRINSYKSGNWSENEKERALRLLQLNQKKLEELQAMKAGVPEPMGNLYKVDVPDEDIPKMLDWDKKLSDQPHIWNSLDQNVKDAIDELMERNYANPMSESLHDYTGEHLYKALKHPEVHDTLPAEVPNSSWYTGDTTNEKHTSQFLNSIGIPGVKYLDQGSRQNIPRIRLVDIDGIQKYEVNPGYNKDKTTLQLAKKQYFDTREEALAHADSFGTRNFVSFKPEDVKILEKNNEPVEFAMGGSVQHMAEGGQPDPIPIQKNNFLTEQAANKTLVEIAKRKALYEIGQIAEQERAKQAANRARPNSLYPATGTLEPSGNGGPMLNNPLNR